MQICAMKNKRKKSLLCHVPLFFIILAEFVLVYKVLTAPDYNSSPTPIRRRKWFSYSSQIGSQNAFFFRFLKDRFIMMEAICCSKFIFSKLFTHILAKKTKDYLHCGHMIGVCAFEEPLIRDLLWDKSPFRGDILHWGASLCQHNRRIAPEIFLQAGNFGIWVKRAAFFVTATLLRTDFTK